MSYDIPVRRARILLVTRRTHCSVVLQPQRRLDSVEGNHAMLFLVWFLYMRHVPVAVDNIDGFFLEFVAQKNTTRYLTLPVEGLTVILTAGGSYLFSS